MDRLVAMETFVRVTRGASVILTGSMVSIKGFAACSGL